MIEQWKELKETIIEMRDNDGTGTQQEVCKFLANLMDVLEKQMSDSENPNKCGDLISRQAVINAIQKLNIPEDMCVFEIISHIEVAIATLPSVENKGDLISRQAVLATLDNMDKALDEERTVEKYKELLTECIKVLSSVGYKESEGE